MASPNQAPILLVFQSGLTMKANLMRHLAPRAFSKVVSSLPLRGAMSRRGEVAVILVNLVAPADKTKSSFDAGEIAYDPRLRAICVTLSRTQGVSMAALGEIEDKGTLSVVRDRDWVELRLA